jgi:predicted ATPase/DNA-binding winged helix-turn-helix (wHTH) protein
LPHCGGGLPGGIFGFAPEPEMPRNPMVSIVAHGRFTVRHASPRIVAGAIAAIEAGELAELPDGEDDGLRFAAGNALVATTTIGPPFGATLLDPAGRAAAPMAPEISFGPFCLLPGQRVLLEAGRPVGIGSRALDLLVALVDRAGHLVTKEELISRVWPNVTVSDGNLKTQIAALRSALGDGRDGARYVVSTPGRGYCFVAPIVRSSGPRWSPTPAASLDSPIDLPVSAARLIGRGGIVQELHRGLWKHRFVTIVGPVGIGKTAVALAVAEALEASCKFSVCFVDLSQLSSQSRVVGALASALGVATSGADATERVIAFLRGRQMLVVLDCCDRVVDEAAVLAERMLEGSPGVRILATSREALRAEGEVVCRLSPLETPLDPDRLTAIEALTFPAIQLFVERASWNIDDFELNDADAPVVAEICRRLDGVPLAIELAAGHVHAFGARGVAAVLGDRFRLLMRGRRTAPQRHKTLGAALDWSYEALSEAERAVLRRLSVFAGAFTLDAACAMSTDAATSAPEVAEIVGSLVAKSLLQADVTTLCCFYRLLETTRAYIEEKLAQSGEMHYVACRYAEFSRATPNRRSPMFTHSIEVGRPPEPGGAPTAGRRVRPDAPLR